LSTNHLLQIFVVGLNEKYEGISIDEQKLLFGDIELDDNKYFSDHKIQ
jgi:hypothetical protein